MNADSNSIENEIILRDKLAIDRTRLANQRTLLAFIRTGIYFVATAVGIAFLGKNEGTFAWKEWTLTVIGCIFVVIGTINYLLIGRKIKRVYRS